MLVPWVELNISSPSSTIEHTIHGSTSSNTRMKSTTASYSGKHLWRSQVGEKSRQFVPTMVESTCLPGLKSI